ncbi:MAG: 2-oxoglutarate dehydrogenase complex dihydrolipoyllysine-residue succinyltransferase [Candidatus Methylacidiphilales bacterium]|nr:2-oxoglutarate dehydrogenase complex dihydrolipoyllysine-residue succinyltransferase [Candidatus Methylacidiphilales bacterium]
MPITVKVPSVGESITSGVLGAWKKKSGDYVKSGEVLFEFETEKVTTEVYADTAGTIKTLVNDGAEIQVGQVVAEIDESAKAPAAGTASAPQSEIKNQKSEIAVDLSPAVRRLVEENKLDAAKIPATGKDGRLIKEDVLNYIQSQLQAAAITPAPQPRSQTLIPRETVSIAASATAASPTGRTSRRKMSQLRKKIADRLVSAQRQAALLTTFNEVDMSGVMTLRKKFQDRFVEKHGVKLGFMSFFVKATVYALQQVPNINARIEGDEIVQNHFYDIGIAISTEKGLFVPVLRNVDQMSLADIEKAIIDYAKKAKAGQIAMSDLEGGVFSITNGGTFGSMLSTPIVNPPQSAILGMHNIVDRPVAIDGRVEIRPIMYAALTYDHRLVDGKEAVTFLVRIKEAIETPALALLEV